MSNGPRRSLVIRTSSSHDDEDVDNQMELFMRHSSPIDRRSSSNGRNPISNNNNNNNSNNNNNESISANASPITVRNSSPSPMGLSRPRSNPRNRTPMRFESPLHSNAFRIPEEDDERRSEEQDRSSVPSQTTEGRRITILPMAGSARGTNIASFRTRHQTAAQSVPTKSRKQGPSHRKVRRWNNDNFVNLAKEVGSKSASEALLRGHANAAQYRSILPTYDELMDSKSRNAMTKLMHCDETNDPKMKQVRDQFFAGELYGKFNTTTTTTSTRKKLAKKKQNGPPSADDKMNRIDKRLRHVVIRAVENSSPATKVLETMESFLLEACSTNPNDQNGSTTTTTQLSWEGILAEAPSITKTGTMDSTITILRFLFDPNSSTGGFNRLLLHALVQFHGLSATSTTTPKGRSLTATGKIVVEDGQQHRLVHHIMSRTETTAITTFDDQLEVVGNRMRAVKV